MDIGPGSNGGVAGFLKRDRKVSTSSTASNASSFDESAADSGAFEREQLEQIIFKLINDGDHDALNDILHNHPASTTILQILLNTSCENRDMTYRYDSEVQSDAHELLGKSIDRLNAIHIACLLGDEEIALDLLEFVARITEEIEARKILFEFVGRVWGNGNTVLHLASFLGMSELVKRLLELGANRNRKNERFYKPVDCADDTETRNMFNAVIEVIVPSSARISTSPKIRRASNSVDELTITSKSKAYSLKVLESADAKLSKHLSSSLPHLPLTQHARTSKLYDSESARTTGISVSGRSAGEIDAVSPSGCIETNIKSSDRVLQEIQPQNHSAKNQQESQNSNTVRLKRKIVVFDPAIRLLYICQHGSTNPENTLQELCDAIKDLGLLHGSLEFINTIVTPHQQLTALHLACTHGHEDIIRELVCVVGARVRVYDREGWTPVHCAAAEGHVNVLRVLAECCQCATADATEFQSLNVFGELTYDGESPLDVAMEGMKSEIDAVLKEIESIQTGATIDNGPRKEYSTSQNFDERQNVEEGEEVVKEREDKNVEMQQKTTPISPMIFVPTDMTSVNMTTNPDPNITFSTEIRDHPVYTMRCLNKPIESPSTCYGINQGIKIKTLLDSPKSVDEDPTPLDTSASTLVEFEGTNKGLTTCTDGAESDNIRPPLPLSSRVKFFELLAKTTPGGVNSSRIPPPIPRKPGQSKSLVGQVAGGTSMS